MHGPESRVASILLEGGKVRNFGLDRTPLLSFDPSGIFGLQILLSDGCRPLASGRGLRCMMGVGSPPHKSGVEYRVGQ